MKKNRKKITILIIICIVFFTNILYSQSLYKIQNSKGIDMKLLGTSTLHKWTMDARTFNGDAQFDFKSGADNQLTSLKSLIFTLNVKNLKGSEKELNKHAYKALKSGQYKDINYKLISAIASTENGSKYLIKTNGNLSIAGVTKKTTMDVYCVLNKDTTITCTGSNKLDMTDYQVNPPTFMLGAMKTGDAITLDFTLVYKKINN